MLLALVLALAISAQAQSQYVAPFSQGYNLGIGFIDELSGYNTRDGSVYIQDLTTTSINVDSVTASTAALPTVCLPHLRLPTVALTRCLASHRIDRQRCGHGYQCWIACRQHPVVGGLELFAWLDFSRGLHDGMCSRSLSFSFSYQ